VSAVAVEFVGLGASPGVAEGVLALRTEDALAWAAQGHRVVLALRDVDAEDTPAVRGCAALVTTAGGLTSDAAIVARALGIPCVTGCTTVTVSGSTLRVADASGAVRAVPSGARVRVDGGAGRVRWEGAVDQ
jgi:pyruvate,orthophosphate dikinase